MNERKQELKDQLIQEQRQTKKMTKAAIERLGRLALNAGLGDIKITDTEMAAGFQDLANRFQ